MTHAVPYKFKIDPQKETGRDTLCQSLRRQYRIASALGTPEGDRLMHELEKSFDFAKRMDKRLRYYRTKYEPHRLHTPELAEGHPEGDDPI